MGKNKRQKHGPDNRKNKPTGKGSRPTGISKTSQPSKPTRKHKQTHHFHPTIPFSPNEHILLIGEGDLSFASSLIAHHGCTNVTATVFESEPELKEKYAHVGGNITLIEEGGGRVQYGVDAGKMRIWTEAGKEVGKGIGGCDRIIFNFPHVGGKTKDVNRQVRYNQELLVSFFNRAIPSLSPEKGSSIVVTLFEGEPYTLWNVRDLARHSGLEVLQSFSFQASAYPGYKHARTLGVVKGKNGEVGAGWKGEERKARSYVFVRKGEGVKMGEGKKKKEESSDDEDEDDHNEDDDSEGGFPSSDINGELDEDEAD